MTRGPSFWGRGEGCGGFDEWKEANRMKVKVDRRHLRKELGPCT